MQAGCCHGATTSRPGLTHFSFFVGIIVLLLTTNFLDTMTQRWRYRTLPAASEVNPLAASLHISQTIAALLVQKGTTTYDQAKAYFRPSLDALHDPFGMKGMTQAVDRLGRALAEGEKILVYGDYDVDGVTSVAMFYGCLNRLKAEADFYIPDRYAEGYGISMQAVKWAAEAGFTLMVSLDCGIRAVNCVQEANKLGIDVIICDHHEPGDLLPAAHAILDPKQIDCPYPNKHLSGCGVGFKLLQALALKGLLTYEQLYEWLDLVAISIACDIVPIVGENRILAHYGLKRLNETLLRPGLQALVELSNGRLPWGISQIVFGLGPRINAAGRMGHASEAVRLLLAADMMVADGLAKAINQKNTLRREVDSTITGEAIAMIGANPNAARAKTTVLFKEEWHKGVIGIVASRCIEQYYRPTIILTASHGKATGSARSVVGYNVYNALNSCADLLEQYGGHAYAAGLTLPLENLTAFQQRFEEVVASTIPDALLIPSLEIDLPLSLDAINNKFYSVLGQMAPFGTGNMRAVLVAENVMAQSYTIIKEEHLKLCLHQQGSGQMVAAIGFGLAHYEPLIASGDPFKIVYTIEENHYLGAKSLQLNIKDIRGM